MINMAFMPLYIWEMWDVTPVTNTRTVESRAVFSLSWIRNKKGNFFLKSPWLKHIGWYYFISCLQFDEIRLLKNMLYEHFPLFIIDWIQEYCKNWNFADDFKFVALYFWHWIYDEKSLKELQSTKSLKILQFLYQILILVRIPCCFISWDLSTRRMRWDQSNLKETFEDRSFW